MYLEGFVEPEYRAGGHVANPVQVTRDKVSLIQPAAEHVIGFISHAGQQSVVLYGSKTTISIKKSTYIYCGCVQSLSLPKLKTAISPEEE